MTNMSGEPVTLLQGIGRQPEHPILMADAEQYTPSSLQFLAEQLSAYMKVSGTAVTCKVEPCQALCIYRDSINYVCPPADL